MGDLLRVGINGFGRIGRAFTRVNSDAKRVQIAAVNDIEPDVGNHVYLLKFDSVYGRFRGSAEMADDSSGVLLDNEQVRFHSSELIDDVSWEDAGVDVVLDATGIQANVEGARRLVESGRVKKVVTTYAPEKGVDLTMIFGANEDEYDAGRHHVVSAGICDTNAIAPVMKVLDGAYGIEAGFVTTLHPWLSYQNLSDGSVQSVRSPGHFWSDYALGRASVGSLIPKNTTTVDVLARVLPEIGSKMLGTSFRVPISIVTASDIVVTLSAHPSAEEVNDLIASVAGAGSPIIGYNDQELVSIDFAEISESVVFDGRWTRSLPNGQVKLVLWYDNEWGYANRALDVVERVGIC